MSLGNGIESFDYPNHRLPFDHFQLLDLSFYQWHPCVNNFLKIFRNAMFFQALRPAWIVDQTIGIPDFMLQHHPFRITNDNADNGKVEAPINESGPFLDQLYDTCLLYTYPSPRDL